MPIKHLPYPLYVLTQAWVFNVVKQRKINLVRYGRLMKTGGNVAKCVQAEAVAKQGEVDVGARAVCAFGP